MLPVGDDIIEAIKKSINNTDDDLQHLLFVHGFKVSFSESILRAAQLGHDLNIEGAVAAFSWPCSKELVKNGIPVLNWKERYRDDEKRIAASIPGITEWIAKLGRLEGTLNIVAHSMGNRGLLGALLNLIEGAESLNLGQVFFTAPDVDQTEFVEHAGKVIGSCNRATLYASLRDRALWASRQLAGGARAGLVPPFAVCDGLDTIDVKDSFSVLSFATGHSYYAEHASVLRDVRSLIADSRPPNIRGLVEMLDPLRWSL